MTHRLQRSTSKMQQDRRGYCATSEVQEYPADFVSDAEYNKNCWFKAEGDREQSEEVWRFNTSVSLTDFVQQWNQ